MRAPLFLFLLALTPNLVAQDFYLKPGDRVLFLGDSNTYSGHYIAYLDAYLAARFPGKSFELINLGLPSETVTGLSEPDHPYPRPDVNERAGRALTKIKPNIVVICYGMNDGIYYPLGEDRFAKYREAILKLADQAEKAGARVTLMTPAPFDPKPVKNVLPAGQPKYSYAKPYQGYDEVLTKYSEWLVSLRAKGRLVVDPHSALLSFLGEVRKNDPSYVISGDGIHPNATGHALVALQLLRAWKAPATLVDISLDLNQVGQKPEHPRVRRFEKQDKTIHLEIDPGIVLPMDPSWHPLLSKDLSEDYFRFVLKVAGMPQGKFELSEGTTKLGTFSHEELRQGIDLARISKLTMNQRAAEMLKACKEKEQIRRLAWLSDVGHLRPGIPKGETLEKARAMIAERNQKIETLSKSDVMKLQLK